LFVEPTSQEITSRTHQGKEKINVSRQVGFVWWQAEMPAVLAGTRRAVSVPPLMFPLRRCFCATICRFDETMAVLTKRWLFL
jgi:hypothetical protein